MSSLGYNFKYKNGICIHVSTLHLDDKPKDLLYRILILEEVISDF